MLTRLTLNQILQDIEEHASNDDIFEAIDVCDFIQWDTIIVYEYNHAGSTSGRVYDRDYGIIIADHHIHYFREKSYDEKLKPILIEDIRIDGDKVKDKDLKKLTDGMVEIICRRRAQYE